MRIPSLGKWTILAGAIAMQVGVSASSVRPDPIHTGELCSRCHRIVFERHVAAEAMSPGHADPLKFRTVRCMLAYLETAAPVDGLFVADYTTGQLIAASDAVYVPVRIDERTGLLNYGIGDVDFLAFAARQDAENMALEYGANTMSWTAVKYYAPFLPHREDVR